MRVVWVDFGALNIGKKPEEAPSSGGQKQMNVDLSADVLIDFP